MKKLVLISIRCKGRRYSRFVWGLADPTTSKTRISYKSYNDLENQANVQRGTTICFGG